MSDNPIKDKSYAFSIALVQYCRLIAHQQKEYILTKQLIRSGTSIGANIEEAQEAQSKKDFISKMSIALKEARETMYWLRIFTDCKISDSPTLPILLSQCDELVCILVAIVKKSRANIEK